MCNLGSKSSAKIWYAYFVVSIVVVAPVKYSLIQASRSGKQPDIATEPKHKFVKGLKDMWKKLKHWGCATPVPGWTTSFQAISTICKNTSDTCWRSNYFSIIMLVSLTSLNFASASAGWVEARMDGKRERNTREEGYICCMQSWETQRK